MLAGMATLPVAATAASISANWAGYVALPKSSRSFTSVSGSWIEPTLTCSAGRESYSAVWVGLGGYHTSSRGLEQIGAEADCLRNGQASYATWYELIPAGPIALNLKTRPGDQMTASVTVIGQHATLRLRDLTMGTRYSVTKEVSSVDTSSAEWIIEAPSSCFSTSACQTLALSDFGTLSFSSATATVGAQTEPASAPSWSEVELELRQGSAVGGGRGGRHAGAESGASLIDAAPSSLSGSQGAFTVRWQEQPLQSEEEPAPGPPPGFGGDGAFRA
jgi:hypothetical protein